MYEQRPSKAWFQSFGFLKIKQNVQSVQLELQLRTLHV
jgi:hypothetical protein